jgi:hypothetical protein
MLKLSYSTPESCIICTFKVHFVAINHVFLMKNSNCSGIPVFMGVSFTAFRSGYPLQVLTGYACCGLFAAIPHAGARTYTLRTRVRHAEGIRSMVQRTEATA